MMDTHTFHAPRPTINANDPWKWLDAGWHEMRQAPVANLLYGVIAAVISVLLISAQIGFDKRVFEESLLVVSPSHQAILITGNRHRDDVKHGADRRYPEMRADQVQRIRALAPPNPRHHAIKRVKTHETDPAQGAEMHLADGPIGEMGQTVDRLDRHQGAFEGAHAVKSHGDHQHAQDRVGVQLVPAPDRVIRPLIMPPQHGILSITESTMPRTYAQSRKAA